MEKIIVGFVVVCTLLLLPSAAALNCTFFYGDYNALCGIVNPLELSEESKSALMNPGAYGKIKEKAEPLKLKVESFEEQITLQSMYEKHLDKVVKIILFVLINYLMFTLPTKTSFLLKWLNVDS